ncbi:5305_t:CDS:1 [Scutellospora calospora]|uniref:5305_t:CDS:1 n=1 Tax=Scutellospora calospora TaxID=85575 RepID=A0ACA9KC00_9GLOM|nr:5305_t:CDS:1 [Scutellospora calospora]
MSGGQTGVDRAALDVALDFKIGVTGWCPKGRIAEDGIIPEKYPLIETDTEEHSQRTEMNIRDSDATLILIISEPNTSSGTAHTINYANKIRKPLKIIYLSNEKDLENENISQVLKWIKDNHIKKLNVAGPRGSLDPEIYKKSYNFLTSLLIRLTEYN